MPILIDFLIDYRVDSRSDLQVVFLVDLLKNTPS